MAPRHVAIQTLFMIAAFFGTLHVNQFDGHHEEQNHDADKFTHEEQPRRQLRRTACPPTLSFCKQEKARKELELQELAKAEEVRKAKLKEKAELAAKAEREWKELKWNQEQERRDALTEERRKRQEEEFDAEIDQNLAALEEAEKQKAVFRKWQKQKGARQVAKYQSQAQKGQQVLTSLVRSESGLSSSSGAVSAGVSSRGSSSTSSSSGDNSRGSNSGGSSNSRGSGALVLALTSEPSLATATEANPFYSNPTIATPVITSRKSVSRWEGQATRGEHHKALMNSEDIAEIFSAWGRRHLLTGAVNDKNQAKLITKLLNASTMKMGKVENDESATIERSTATIASATLYPMAAPESRAANQSKQPAWNSTRRRYLTVSACPKSLPLCQETRRQQRQREIMQQRMDAIAAAKAEAKNQEMRAARAAARAEEQAKARAAAAPTREAERARAVKLREQKAADAAAAVEIENMDTATRNRHVLSAFLREKRSAQKLRAAVGQGGGAKRRRRPLPDTDAVLKQANEVDYAERRAALIVKRLVVDKGEAPWQKGGGAGMRGRRREPRLRESFYSYDGSDDSSSGDSGIGGRSSSVSAPDAGLWDNEAAAAAKELFTRSSAAVKSGRADANTQRRLRVLKGSDDFRDLRNAEVHQSSHARDRKSNETFSSSNSTQVASRRITQPPQVQHYQQPEQARRRLVSFCPPTVPLCAARKRAKKEAILKDAKEALANKAKAQAAAAERSEANAIRRAELEERERAAAIERQWEKERAHKAAESERLGAFKEYMRSHKGEMGVDRVYKQLGAAHAKDATQWDYKAELRTLRAAKAAALIEKQEIAAAKVEAAMNKGANRRSFLRRRDPFKATSLASLEDQSRSQRDDTAASTDELKELSARLSPKYSANGGISQKDWPKSRGASDTEKLLAARGWFPGVAARNKRGERPSLTIDQKNALKKHISEV